MKPTWKSLSWLGLLIPLLNLFLLVDASTAQAANLPAWRDPGITLGTRVWNESTIILKALDGNVCFDPTRPGELILANKSGERVGTYAYNPVSGQQTRLSSHIAQLCFKDQYFEPQQSKDTQSALRFSAAHPDGQIIDHYPNAVSQDGSNILYSTGEYKGNYGIWFSDDAGTTWQLRSQSLGTGPFTVAVTGQDAHSLYALHSGIVDRGTRTIYTRYTVWFSADAGLTWQKRSDAGQSVIDTTREATSIIKPLAGPNVPVGTVLIETTFPSATTGDTITTSVSTDGGRNFAIAGNYYNLGRSSSAIQLFQTPGGIVRLLNDTDPTHEKKILSRTQDGKTWGDLNLPASYYDTASLLSQDPTSGNNLFLSEDGKFWHSPDGGISWQAVAQPVADPNILPSVLKVLSYQPLTLWASTEFPDFYSFKDLSVHLIILDGPSLIKPAFPAGATSTTTYFPQTGHNLSGAFRKYWEAHGGLAQFGLPWTEVFPEVSASDGKTYQVQYFERARLEYHPEFAGTDSEVLLGLAGSLLTVSRKNDPAFQPVADPNQAGVNFYNRTGHTLSGTFKTYWEAHGGLSIYGYPISEPLQEVNPDDGQTYTVQYFERNRFEYHPTNKGTPYEVLLGLLGNKLLRDKGWL